MKVFMIGGTGLLGSEAAKVLIERGHEVIAERIRHAFEEFRRVNGAADEADGQRAVLQHFADAVVGTELLGIKPGETTEDGLFTLDALRCIGACGIAPAVSINGKVYPKVDVEEVEDIIASYRKEATA